MSRLNNPRALPALRRASPWGPPAFAPPGPRICEAGLGPHCTVEAPSLVQRGEWLVRLSGLARPQETGFSRGVRLTALELPW